MFFFYVYNFFSSSYLIQYTYITYLYIDSNSKNNKKSRRKKESAKKSVREDIKEDIKKDKKVIMKEIVKEEEIIIFSRIERFIRSKKR